MSDTTFSHAAGHSSLTHRAAGMIQSLGQRFAQHRQFRQTINELSVLNDRELRDLGLNRSSLRSVAYEAVYGND